MVSNLTDNLEPKQREEDILNRKAHRPWRRYHGNESGGRFNVTRIQLKLVVSLSLQKHHHRAEAWILVKGAAGTNRDVVFLRTEVQLTCIRLGEARRLANSGAIPREIIEVQSGSYPGEDDIVRFEDHYGRNKS
jgi:mannose-1-phosphate guanylyltransferase/mannose-6-phosphate isomerase